VQLTFAQEKTVTGTVVDGDGLPIPGVNVIIKNTSTGTQTDFDGNYTIQASSDDVLVFSYTGMKTMEMTVGSKTTLDVSMEQNLEALEEVVVVGYSKTTKESFTGTATSIDTEDLDDKVVSNITDAVRGEVAGVNVITRSGQPGQAAEIRIRGFGSVNGNSEPLYVLDGAPLGRGGDAAGIIQSLNPSDIESFVVLKDAAATSIYGSRGANGVILVTTVKGKKGQSSIVVDFKTSINNLFLPEYDVITSPEEYMELSWQNLRNTAQLQGNPNPGQFASNNLFGDGSGLTINDLYNIWDAPNNQLIDPQTGRFNQGVRRNFTPTRWRDAAFSTGIRTEANVQFSGGSEKTNYSFSLGYLDSQGFSLNSEFTRYTARLNLDHEATDWLTIGGNLSWTGSRSNFSGAAGDAGSSANPFALAYTMPAIYDVFLRDQDGNLVPDPIFGGNQFDYGDVSGRRAFNATNAVAVATYDLEQTDASTMLGNFYANMQFTDWLSFETRYSGTYDYRQNADRNNPFYGGASNVGGSLFLDDDLRTNQNFLQLLRFQNTYGDHDVEVFAAHESTEFRFRTISGAAEKAIIPGTTSLSQYTTALGRADSFQRGWTLDSYFGGLNYDYADKYFLTASIRRDGSSRFIKNQWGTFGSVGAGWIASRESFLSDVDNLDFLKLKASYGVIGDVGNNLLNGFQIFNINQDPNGNYSFTISSTLANPELTWETSSTAQVGFESTFFDGLLSLDVDYYDRTTTDLFFFDDLPPSQGQTQILYNGGELQNAGLEFTLNANIIDKKDMRFSVAFNGETFKNEITEMPISVVTGERPVFDSADNVAKGKSQWDWWLREWAGVNPANGEALWYQYYVDDNNNGIFDPGELSTADGFPVDVDGDGSSDNESGTLYEYRQLNPDATVRKTTTNRYSDATQVFTGQSAIPDLRGGFRLNFGYKNFDIAAQFSYSIGGYTYDAGYERLMATGTLIGADNFHTDVRQAWQQPGDITDVPRLTSQFSNDGQANETSSRFLTKSDFLSLNNVNISYKMPKSVQEALNMDSFSIFIAGDNLMFLSRRNGFNPSTAIATTNSGAYAPLSTFTFGTRIKF
jgi:TonB-linked SusC/RagA family outer membrane protein